MISNCGHDERGKYSGGKAGDQTRTEWQVINWYNRPPIPKRPYRRRKSEQNS